MSADPRPSHQPGADAHRLTVTVAFAITPAGLASYARRHGFGADPAEHAKALEHLTRQLPGYVDTGLYRTPDLEPTVWAVTVAESAEDRAARHQAKAVRDADRAAQLAAEAELTERRRRTT